MLSFGHRSIAILIIVSSVILASGKTFFKKPITSPSSGRSNKELNCDHVVRYGLLERCGGVLLLGVSPPAEPLGGGLSRGSSLGELAAEPDAPVPPWELLLLLPIMVSPGGSSLADHRALLELAPP
jgi:hypothetical protein